MQATYESPDELAQALRRAAAAHGRHEQQLGHADPDWPSWYAQYMFDEQTGHPDQAMQGEQAARGAQTQPAEARGQEAST